MRVGVIGSPIDHSRSPQIHQAAYAWLGLDWEYSAHQVEASEVKDFVAGLDPTWRGLSVTMPCKEAILALGTPDPVVEALGVGNTVVFDGTPSSPQTTRIFNTDVTGVQMLLSEIDPESEVRVLGNGATARSSIFALARQGFARVQVQARDHVKSTQVSEDAKTWGIEVVPPESTVDLLISTIPSSTALEWVQGVSPQVIVDVLYHPWPTQLAQFGQECGARVFSGLDLLAAQAVGQVKFMTGNDIPFSVLRDAAEQ